MSPEIRDALLCCPSLPTLPGVAIRILEMARDPEVNIGDLAGVLAQDPALSSRLLKICNSPLYAQRRNTSNLHQAVMLLGMNATVSLALSFNLSAIYSGSGGGYALIDGIWRRALVSAMAARMLGKRLMMGGLDELYLAALLQDLGVLALKASLPERYLDLLGRAQTHAELLGLERAALGTDHGEAGGWLMTHWGLPERLASAPTAAHLDDLAAVPEDRRSFVACVVLAGALADALLHSRLEEDLDALGARAESWLGLDRPSVDALIEDAIKGLPEVETLFEIEILTPAMSRGLLDQAHEIMAIRNLRLLHQASEHHQRFVEMEQAAELLQKAAIHDALTGLHNRRYFDQVLETEFAQATEHAWPLALGFVDLDFFKQINDSHGHVTGDSVLVAVAGVLRKNLRDRDYVMRYGGEEFVVLLPGHGLDAAARVFERLRAAVAAAQHLDADGDIFRVTASIGIAAHMDGDRRTEDCIQLVRAADRALYDAKRKGRNRIEFAL